MAQVRELRTTADAEAMLAASHEAPVVLLKHSVACPVSARGQGQVAALDGPGAPPRYVVVVQYAREVSTWLAERLGVRHETPQALVLRDGAAVFVQNHSRIHTEDLRQAAREAAGAGGSRSAAA